MQNTRVKNSRRYEEKYENGPMGATEVHFHILIDTRIGGCPDNNSKYHGLKPCGAKSLTMLS